MMDYKQALAESKRTGAAKAQGEAHLAMTCRSLSHLHAINPAMVYSGAQKRSLTGYDLLKLSGLELGDLMFVE